jgi:hypothetical protein
MGLLVDRVPYCAYEIFVEEPEDSETFQTPLGNLSQRLVAYELDRKHRCPCCHTGEMAFTVENGAEPDSEVLTMAVETRAEL